MDGPSGVLALDPFPLGDLLSRRHLTAHVMTALHCDGKLLRLHVGSDVVDLGDLTREGGPGTTDVEVSGFVHVGMMARIQGNCKGLWTVQKVAQGRLWGVLGALY